MQTCKMFWFLCLTQGVLKGLPEFWSWTAKHASQYVYISPYVSMNVNYLKSVLLIFFLFFQINLSVL